MKRVSPAQGVAVRPVSTARSATTARKIKHLIQDSVKKVEDGTAFTAQSGKKLDPFSIARRTQE
jgi:hypothetical protein